MATEVGRGIIPVTFDKDQIGRDLHSSFDEGSRKAEGGIGSTFKRLAGVASAAFAGVQVFSFFKDSVEGAREANKIAAQTEAVIKSTGGAAGLSADQFSKLAESISLKTGIDDEQIQSAENLLATFTNLKDGVGANNDIFSQATKIAVDMGAALGGDASSNAIQLGKALNDPIKGISALTRVGVTFTDEQRNLIKTLQESGDVAGAQKVILAELNKEFGGSAEATATAGAKFGVFWGNLQEKVGNFIIPMLDGLAEWATSTLPDAFGTLQDRVVPVFDAIGGVILSVFDEIQSFWTTLTTGFTEDDAATGVEKFALILRDDVFPIVKNVALFLKDNFKPILVGLVAAFAAFKVVGFVQAIMGAVGAVTSFIAASGGMGAAWIAIGGPPLLIAAAIAVLIGAFVLAYMKIEWFRDAVNAVIGPLVDFVTEQFANLSAAVSERWATISEAIGNVLTAITIAVAVFMAPLILIWTQFHDQILAVVGIVWDQIKLYVETAISIVVGIIDLALALLTGDWSAAWDALAGIVTAVWDLIKGTVENAFAILGQFVSIGMQGVSDLFSLAWEGILGVFTGAFDKIVEFFTGLPGRLAEVAGDVFGFLRESFRSAINFIIRGWNALEFSIPGFDAPGPLPDFEGFTIGMPKIKELAMGGSVLGGQPIRWGEGGRGELFVPDTSGLVVSNNQLATAMNALGGRSGNTYQLSSGPVYVNEPQDIETGFQRLELLAGV